MPRNLADSAQVLFANEAFYLAFGTRDLDAMDQIWSQRAPISCIHPGWEVVRSRPEVMSSWQGIMEAEQSPDITVHSARAVVLGDSAIVVCYERINETDLAATNVFVREPEGWKLVHHQAGICHGRPEADLEDDRAAPMQ